MDDVCIIGAGIAGTSVASSLSERGLKVSIVERASKIAQGASGNPAGMINPYLTHSHSPLAEVYHAAWQITQDRLSDLSRKLGRPLAQSCGAYQLLSTPRFKRFGAKLTSAQESPFNVRMPLLDEVSHRLGFTLTECPLFSPLSSVLSPEELCAAHIEAAGPNLTLHLSCDILSIERDQGNWKLYSPSLAMPITARSVVVAASFDSTRFHGKTLRLEPIRGEILSFSENVSALKVPVALCYDGYLLPPVGGRIVLGSSFQHLFKREEMYLSGPPPLDSGLFMPQTVCRQEIVGRLIRWAPHCASLDLDLGVSRVSFRASTHDRLPYIGPIPEYSGLYVSAGHGSRGLITAHLAAKVIADQISGITSSLNPTVLNFVSPTRA